MASRKKTLLTAVTKAKKAWRELELGQISQADKKRAWDVLEGMQALDDEQARLKGSIEELVIEFFNPNAPDDDVNELLRRLLALIAEAPARPKEDQEALDAIARELAKEDKLCLKERPKRPSAKSMRRTSSPAPTSSSATTDITREGGTSSTG